MSHEPCIASIHSGQPMEINWATMKCAHVASWRCATNSVHVALILFGSRNRSRASSFHTSTVSLSLRLMLCICALMLIWASLPNAWLTFVDRLFLHSASEPTTLIADHSSCFCAGDKWQLEITAWTPNGSNCIDILCARTVYKLVDMHVNVHFSALLWTVHLRRR